MEKSPSSSPPNYTVMYNTFKPPSKLSNIIDNAGSAFSQGTIGGLMYHLIKSGKPPSTAGFIAACPNAPRVGGFCAMYTLAVDISACGLDYLRGEGSSKSMTSILALNAASAALMWAASGLRSASHAALLCPLTIAAAQGSVLWLRKFSASASASIPKDNTYYHLP